MKLISRNGTKVLALMEDYLSQQGISQQLFKVEIDNLKIYGYGIKGYILYD
jgi:putative hydrolase of the HAD superfamily